MGAIYVTQRRSRRFLNVFCSFLALLLKVELERRMQFADLECEWAQVLRGQLNAEASAAVRAAGVAAPPTVRELP
jgi:hypothetical protein